MAWTMASATSGFLAMVQRQCARVSKACGFRRSTPLVLHEGLLGQAHYVNDDNEQALEWVRSALTRNGLIRFNHRLLIVTLVLGPL